MKQVVIQLLAMLAVVFAGPSLAEPITVRSGAHDGFSRLVLDVSPGMEWTLDKGGDRARVILPEHNDGFDIARVFERIDQSRVAALERWPNSLEIQLACACTVVAFAEGDRMIVLDIVDAPGQIDDTVERTAEGQSAPLPMRSLPFATETDTANGALAQSPALREVRVPFADAANLGRALSNIQAPPTADSLGETQKRIAAQFSAAATRGLLKPKTAQIDLPMIQSTPQIDLRIFDSSHVNPAPESRPVSPRGGNVRITSSADIPTGNGTSTASGADCAAPGALSIQDWATEKPFSAQIAQLRNALYTELDRLDHATAIALARTYLHFGFGAEARQILLMHPDLARDHPAFLEMSEILEFGHVTKPAYLHHFVECDTDLALWAILAERPVDPAKNINVNAALRAATAMPMHLRKFIAPELSNRLLDYGKPDAAAAALRSLERAPEPLSPNANLAKAKLEIEQGDVTEAQDRLAQVVTSNVEQSAEALIQFVDSHLDADARIDESVATLVEGYALQMRDDPIGAELRRAHVLALGKSGQFDAAFDALDRVRERDANTTDQALKSSILTLLTQGANDIAFLDHVFDQMTFSLGAVDPQAKVMMADRLVDLGFAREAETILASRDDIPKTKRTKMLRARIALALERPFEAEAAITTLDTPEAELLRAEAKVLSGAFEDAYDLLADLGEEDRSQQTAWLSNAWTDLVAQDASVFGGIARVAQTELPDDPNLQGMLSRTDAAIAESARARGTIRDLLRASATPALVE